MFRKYNGTVIKTKVKEYLEEDIQNARNAAKNTKELLKSDYIMVTFGESSIHGMAHVVENERHFLERLFWILTIAASIYAAISICLDQWNRYQVNPTVLSLEIDYRNWKYDHITGITICSDHIRQEDVNSMIQRFWNISLESNKDKYEYYYDFILTVASTKYNNLHKLAKFASDSSFDNLDFLEIARTAKENVQPVPNILKAVYNLVITEFGICVSTTHLYDLQNPYTKREDYNPTPIFTSTCLGTEISCDFIVVGAEQDNTPVLNVFLHDLRDVISANSSILAMIELNTAVSLRLGIDETRASESLIDLSPARRNCLFTTESSLGLYDVYTVNLCRITCRIKNAVEICGCRPFFYNTDYFGKSCNLKGLICLSKYDWYKTSCHCPSLCESRNYKELIAQSMIDDKFNRMLTVRLEFPKYRIKRNILFSTNDLLVSFGGAAALFLGLSFLSVVEIGYFILDVFFQKLFHRQ